MLYTSCPLNVKTENSIFVTKVLASRIHSNDKEAVVKGDERVEESSNEFY